MCEFPFHSCYDYYQRHQGQKITPRGNGVKGIQPLPEAAPRPAGTTDAVETSPLPPLPRATPAAVSGAPVPTPCCPGPVPALPVPSWDLATEETA